MAMSTSGATQSWTVPVIPLGNVSAGVVVWRRGGRLHIGPIVKATFAFVKGGPMTPAAPLPFRTAEQPRDDTPDASIRASVDTAPLLPHGEVLFNGHAHAPAGVDVPRVGVRLFVHTAQGVPLVDKRLEVLGDRLLVPGRPPPEATPFKRMPIVYERTYGGPDHGLNPVGLGQLAALGGRRRLPNIIHPPRSPFPAVEPAGFGPISIEWPARRRMLRATPRSVLERPIMEIPDDLDLAYFQAAPIDQQIIFLQGGTLPERRIKYFHGDEWVVLEGLHSLHGVLETQLPGARGVARVYLPGGLNMPVELVADTLFIDGDTERCSITWRGSFPLPSQADLPATAVAVAVEMPGQTVAWPDRLQVSFPGMPGAPPPLPMPGAPPPLPMPGAPARMPSMPGIAPMPGMPPMPGAPPAPPMPPAARPAAASMVAGPVPQGARPAPPPPRVNLSSPAAAGPAPAPPPPARPAPARPAPAPKPPGDDESWGVGTMVMMEEDEKPMAARRATEGTTVMEASAAPAPRRAPPPAPPPPDIEIHEEDEAAKPIFARRAREGTAVMELSAPPAPPPPRAPPAPPPPAPEIEVHEEEDEAAKPLFARRAREGTAVMELSAPPAPPPPRAPAAPPPPAPEIEVHEEEDEAAKPLFARRAREGTAVMEMSAPPAPPRRPAAASPAAPPRPATAPPPRPTTAAPPRPTTAAPPRPSATPPPMPKKS